MIRPTTRRSPNLESLESREVLSAGGPSAEAQYMLEILNQARTNPRAVAERVTTDLDADIHATIKYYNVDINAVRNDISSMEARQPLAWNDRLASAAVDHSMDLANAGVQSHTGTDGSSPGERIQRAGYANKTGDAENVYAYSESVDHAMEAFLIDWGVSGNGHRNNIMQPNASPDQQWDEVGIGIVDSNKPGFGPEVITQNFASRSDAKPYLLGVAYNDKNNNRAYDLYEGQGDVQIEATNVSTGETSRTATWDNGGGYQMPLNPGTYQVVAKVGDRVIRNDRVTIGGQNVKVDYNLNDVPQSTPAPAPQPIASTGASTRLTASTSSTSRTAASWVISAPQDSSTGFGVWNANRAGVTRTSSSWLPRWSAWTARRGS